MFGDLSDDSGVGTIHKRMHVHVVPAVHVEQVTPERSFELKACPKGDTAGRFIVNGVEKIQAVQPEAFEGPVAQ
jgi:hypothetical protein